MELNIDYLKTFITLTETQGFTKTGLLLNKSQSAVSMQIKRLEAEVARPLVIRTGKGIELTGAGKLLLSHAHRIVREHDDAVRALTIPDMTGIIRFAAPEHYTVGILPQLLAEFAKDYPDVLVDMQCKNSPEIKMEVENGTLDIGLSTQLTESDHVLAHDPLVWIASPQFALPHKSPLPLALFDESCMFRAWALRALTQRKIEHRIVYVSHSVAGLIDAVRAGLAVAPVVKSNVPKDLHILGPHKGLPVLPVTNIVMHQKKNSSTVIKSFADHIMGAFNR